MAEGQRIVVQTTDQNRRDLRALEQALGLVQASLKGLPDIRETQSGAEPDPAQVHDAAATALLADAASAPRPAGQYRLVRLAVSGAVRPMCHGRHARSRAFAGTIVTASASISASSA